MTDPFPAFRGQFSEVSLPRLAKILPQTKTNPAAKIIEKLVEGAFDHNSQAIDFESESLNFMDIHITKEQFYDLVRKETIRNLKKKQKSMESILAHLNNSKEMNEETKKINRLRHIIAFIKSIEMAAYELYGVICEFQELKDWACPCNTAPCYAKKSLQHFQVDIYIFLFATTKIFAEQIQQHRLHIETKLIITFENLMNANSDISEERLREMKFEMEHPCLEMKEKKKKKNKSRNKSKKNKKKMQEEEKQERDDNEEKEEPDEDEKQLNAFLEKLEIMEEDRVECRVSESWTLKIMAQNYFIGN